MTGASSSTRKTKLPFDVAGQIGGHPENALLTVRIDTLEFRYSIIEVHRKVIHGQLRLERGRRYVSTLPADTNSPGAIRCSFLDCSGRPTG